MTDTTEVWIRVPRRVFNDARDALDIASSELRSAHNTSSGLATHYLRAAQRADTARGALDAHACGIAIERTLAS